jgi:type VI secretion system secreted protein Hcp
MAFDTFLKIDGLVDSTTTTPGHEGTIEVFSFSWGVSNSAAVGAGTGAGAGKASLSSFNLMKKADAASPALFLACAQGAHYKSATVTISRAAGSAAKSGAAPFIEYDLTNVFVESVQWSGSSGGDDAPSESVSLAFTKLVYKSTPQNPDGSTAPVVQTGWDLSANQQA